jgi:hypothetical protein
MLDKKLFKLKISNLFRKWEEDASLEEKQKFCDDANALAAVIFKSHENQSRIKIKS